MISHVHTDDCSKNDMMPSRRLSLHFIRVHLLPDLLQFETQGTTGKRHTIESLVLKKKENVD